MAFDFIPLLQVRSRIAVRQGQFVTALRWRLHVLGEVSLSRARVFGEAQVASTKVVRVPVS